MAPFHEENILIISPGSLTTVVQFGLHETYAPPTIEIPTKVYRHAGKDNVFSSTGDESDAVYPIVKGEIADINALNFFIKLIFRSVPKSNINVHNIPVLLVSTSKFSRLEIEQITQYAFETIEVSAFAVLPSALAALYAYGNQSNAVVIDIGYEKTEIVPIVDYSVAKYARKVIEYGGNNINQNLQKQLPDLTPSQIESLKKSEIYEVLSDEDKKNSFFGTDALADNAEDEFDVAAIVTSGRTREILEEREKKNEEKIPNSQLEKNSFIYTDGDEITLGKERFRGTEVLISRIAEAAYLSLSKITDLTKRQESWNHIILIGRTSKIAGFAEALNTKLIESYLIGKELIKNAPQVAFQSTTQPAVSYSQVPNSIKFAKIPEYFPEWKKSGTSDLYFLGAQIVSKQIFDHGHHEPVYVSRQEYNEKGPSAIWDGAF